LGGYAGSRSKARDKVLNVAQELGYTPNKLARGLASKRSYKIGVIIPDIENLYFARLYRGLEQVCHQEGFTLVLGISSEDPVREKHLLMDMLSEQVEGIIIAPSDGLESAGAIAVPIVSVDRIPDKAAQEISWVCSDNYDSSYRAAEHLIGQGYNNISVIVNLPHLSTIRERLAGINDAARNTDAKLSTLVTTSYLLERIVPEINEFLRAHRPDAVIVTDTVICTAFVIAARELGIQLGKDLALITYDDEPWMSLLEPSITAIEQPVLEMGKTAAQLLLEQMSLEEQKAAGKRLQSKLIVRGSTQK
jgi:LacI family transcriptional regulator